jgi:hypothetical protein
MKERVPANAFGFFSFAPYGTKKHSWPLKWRLFVSHWWSQWWMVGGQSSTCLLFEGPCTCQWPLLSFKLVLRCFLVLFFCFLSGWVASLSCLLISCCNLVIGSSLNSFQVDFNCTYGKSLVLLNVLSLPLDSGTILFKQSYDYGLYNDLSFHVGRFLEKEKLVSADFNQGNLLLLLPDPDPSWMPILQGLRNSKI